VAVVPGQATPHSPWIAFLSSNDDSGIMPPIRIGEV
jgi:hypothetical protein